MPRGTYGLDPESLAATGPRALAGTFGAALQGMEFGDNLASSALQRELLRRNEERVVQDRLTAATLDSSPAAMAPQVGAQRGAGGSPAFGSILPSAEPVVDGPSAPGPEYAPRSFADFAAAQTSTASGVEQANRALGDYYAARGPVGERPFGAVVDSMAGSSVERTPTEGTLISGPLGNPLTKIGYPGEMVVSPAEAAQAIRRRAVEYGMDLGTAENLVQEYESFYAQATNSFGRMQADRQAQAQAAADMQAQAQHEQDVRGYYAILRRSPARKNDSDEMVMDMARTAATDPKAFALFSGQAGDQYETGVTAGPNYQARALERREYDDSQIAFKRARQSEGEAEYNASQAAGDSDAVSVQKAQHAMDKFVDVATVGRVTAARENPNAALARDKFDVEQGTIEKYRAERDSIEDELFVELVRNGVESLAASRQAKAEADGSEAGNMVRVLEGGARAAGGRQDEPPLTVEAAAALTRIQNRVNNVEMSPAEVMDVARQTAASPEMSKALRTARFRGPASTIYNIGGKPIPDVREEPLVTEEPAAAGGGGGAVRVRL